MASAPRAMAAMTPGGISREGEEARGAELEVGVEADCSSCGVGGEVGAVVSRRGAAGRVVTREVLSVRIVSGRGSVEGEGEMVRSGARIVAGVGSLVGVVDVVEMTAPSLLSWTPPSSMANAGQKLVFDGSASGTMEIVNARPERTPAVVLGTTSA